MSAVFCFDVGITFQKIKSISFTILFISPSIQVQTDPFLTLLIGDEEFVADPRGKFGSLRGAGSPVFINAFLD